jgi:hypothetical protein
LVLLAACIATSTSVATAIVGKLEGEGKFRGRLAILCDPTSFDSTVVKGRRILEATRQPINAELVATLAIACFEIFDSSLDEGLVRWQASAREGEVIAGNNGRGDRLDLVEDTGKYYDDASKKTTTSAYVPHLDMLTRPAT